MERNVQLLKIYLNGPLLCCLHKPCLYMRSIDHASKPVFMVVCLALNPTIPKQAAFWPKWVSHCNPTENRTDFQGCVRELQLLSSGEPPQETGKKGCKKQNVEGCNELVRIQHGTPTKEKAPFGRGRAPSTSGSDHEYLHNCFPHLHVFHTINSYESFCFPSRPLDGCFSSPAPGKLDSSHHCHNATRAHGGHPD